MPPLSLAAPPETSPIQGPEGSGQILCDSDPLPGMQWLVWELSELGIEAAVHLPLGISP